MGGSKFRLGLFLLVIFFVQVTVGRRVYKEVSSEELAQLRELNHRDEAKDCVPKLIETPEEEVEELFSHLEDRRVLPFPKGNKDMREVLEKVDKDEKMHSFFNQLFEKLDDIVKCVTKALPTIKSGPKPQVTTKRAKILKVLQDNLPLSF